MTLIIHLQIFIFLLLLTKISLSHEFLSINNEYVPLIIDICKLYHVKSVIFLYAESIKEMDITTILFKWTRTLSREDFMTNHFYFSQMHKSLYYVKKIVQPLYVALISNYETINEFFLATSTFNMSYAVWLVIFIYKGNDIDYCHNPPGNIFHLRFDSQMLVLCDTENILREWYSLDTNQTNINDLATWNLEKGITLITSKSLYERRNNLQGTIMKAVLVQKSPTVIKINKEITGETFYKLFTELSRTLNFTIKVVSKVKDYGIYNGKKHTWNGAIGEIYSGRADISISDIIMTSKRLNAVDFTLPIYFLTDCLYFQKPQNFAVNWSTYFLTLTYPVWIAVFLILLLSSILIIFIKIKIETDRDLLHLGSDSFLEIWGILCQQGLIEFPKRTSLKIAYFSMFLFGIVLSAAYSAFLISALTSTTYTIPFYSFETFIQEGTYKLSVLHNNADYDSFLNADKPLIKKAMKMMIEKDKLPVNLLDVFNSICDNPKLVYYTFVKIKDSLTFDLPCNIISIKTGTVKSLSIMLSKHNQFKGIINFHLEKFINNGMLNRLKDTTYAKKYEEPIQEHIPVSIDCVISLLFFILIGAILSICILFVEKFVYAYKMKKDLMVDLIPSIKSPRLRFKRKTILKNIANNLVYRNE